MKFKIYKENQRNKKKLINKFKFKNKIKILKNKMIINLI